MLGAYASEVGRDAWSRDLWRTHHRQGAPQGHEAVCAQAETREGYLYGTDTFGTMFAEIISHLLPTGGKHDLGCDECLIVNQLWTEHHRLPETLGKGV